MSAPPNPSSFVPAAYARDFATAELVSQRFKLAGIPSDVGGDYCEGQSVVTIMVPTTEYDRAIHIVINLHLQAIPTSCHQCRYDLAGIEATGRCPECGAAWSTWMLAPGEVWAAPKPQRKPALTGPSLRTFWVVSSGLVLLFCILIVATCRST